MKKIKYKNKFKKLKIKKERNKKQKEVNKSNETFLNETKRFF